MHLNELKQQSQDLNQCPELDEQAELSGYFREGPPPGKAYYIPMQLPKGESIYSRACSGVVLTADGVAAILRIPLAILLGISST